MQDKKTQPTTPPKPAGPTRDAVDLLKAVSKRAQDATAKKKTATEPPPPESLPENWGVGDLVRVGASRLKRAVYGPPQSDAKK